MNYYAKGGEAHGIKSLDDTYSRGVQYKDGVPSFGIGGSLRKAWKGTVGAVEDLAKPITEPITDAIKPILPYVQYVAPFIPGVGTATAVALGALGSGFAGGGGFNLKRGIMGGITAYGMSNLAQGLSAAGNPAAGSTAPPPVELGVPGTDAVAGEVARTGLAEPGLAAQLGAGDYSGAISNIASQGADAVRTGVNTLTNPETYKAIGDSLTTQGQGITNLMSGDEAAMKAFGSKFGTGSAGAVLMGTTGQAAINEMEQLKLQSDLAKAKSEAERNEILARIESNRQRGVQAIRTNPYQFAMGGVIPQMAPGGLAALQAERDGYEPRQTVDGNIPQMAAGGMPPRFLSGGGDGMSDDIPATINDKQPARLADGEFVIPADVVSHLGNGSSKAGAKQLYSMMDKVRQARTGTKKQGKQINPNKFMPV